jgi:hypothetical protein
MLPPPAPNPRAGCAYACTDDARKPADVSACTTACQEPLATVREGINEAQAAFQRRVARCHEIAGEALGPRARGADFSAADIATYVGKLRPCFREEINKLPALMAPVRASIGAAAEATRAVTPLFAGDIAAPAKKAGWF